MKRKHLVVLSVCSAFALMTALSFAKSPNQKTARKKTPTAAKTTPAKPAKKRILRMTSMKLDALLKTYSRQGHHRTGSHTSQQSGRWIQSLLQGYGYQVTMSPLSFQRSTAGRSTIDLIQDKRTLVGMPLLNSKGTGRWGVEGRLGLPGEVGKIPVFHLYAMLPSKQFSAQTLRQNYEAFNQLVMSGSYPAVIAVTQGDRAGLVALNINTSEQVKTPVILISSMWGNLLEMKAKIHSEIRLRTQINTEKATDYTVIAKLPGRDPSAKPVVVILPRTGWYSAGAESGSSVVAMLMAAEKAAHDLNARRTLIWVALTGNELTNMGIHHFVKAHHDLISGAHAVIYIGPNIAVRPHPNYVAQASSQALQEMATRSMMAGNMQGVHWLGSSKPSVGLARWADVNVPYISIAALNNACFNMECDKWTNVDIIEELRFTRALYGMVAHLAH